MEPYCKVLLFIFCYPFHLVLSLSNKVIIWLQKTRNSARVIFNDAFMVRVVIFFCTDSCSLLYYPLNFIEKSSMNIQPDI